MLHCALQLYRKRSENVKGWRWLGQSELRCREDFKEKLYLAVGRCRNSGTQKREWRHFLSLSVVFWAPLVFALAAGMCAQPSQCWSSCLATKFLIIELNSALKYGFYTFSGLFLPFGSGKIGHAPWILHLRYWCSWVIISGGECHLALKKNKGCQEEKAEYKTRT